jgi:alanine racemase
MEKVRTKSDAAMRSADFDDNAPRSHGPSAMSPEKFEPTWLTIRLGAIVENFRRVQQLAAPAAAAAVVKADAYGLGMPLVATALAARAHCDAFFVARHSEGVQLRPLVKDARIYVLDGAPPDAVPALISHRLTPVLNSITEVAAWSAAGRAMRTDLDAALHVDTGMNRLGVPTDELAVLAAEAAKRFQHIRLVLLMSHLACADDPSSPMNPMQLDRFRTALAMLPTAPASLASSGGVMLGKDYAFDLVRPGLGLYGGNPQPAKSNPFMVAARLTGRVLQVRRVDKGESVGYGATFRAGRPAAIATVSLGYADGLMRANGNRGSAVIEAARAPIVGRISMDLVTLDVSDIASVRPGTEVEFVGDALTLEELAETSGTASYEILTSLSRRARRVYIEDAR